MVKLWNESNVSILLMSWIICYSSHKEENPKHLTTERPVVLFPWLSCALALNLIFSLKVPVCRQLVLTCKQKHFISFLKYHNICRSLSFLSGKKGLKQQRSPRVPVQRPERRSTDLHTTGALVATRLLQWLIAPLGHLQDLHGRILCNKLCIWWWEVRVSPGKLLTPVQTYIQFFSSYKYVITVSVLALSLSHVRFVSVWSTI